jgi:hypothetical protein
MRNGGDVFLPDGFVDKEGRILRSECYTSISTENIPALLHTNRESRAEGLKLYSLWLGNQHRYPVYFNFANDYLLLKHEGDAWRLIHDFLPSDPNALKEQKDLQLKLRHLMIVNVNYRDCNFFSPLILHEIKHLRNLKTLIFPKSAEELNFGISHQNAIRAWLHEFWTSKSPLKKRDDYDELHALGPWRLRETAEKDEIKNWWESVHRTVESGEEIPAPLNMQTKVLFMDKEEIEAMLGQPLPPCA